MSLVSSGRTVARLRSRLEDAHLAVRIRRVAGFFDLPPDVVRGFARDYLAEVDHSAYGAFDLEIYLLVRGKKPALVVETGVNRGWSSAAILRALRHNDRGRLISIDLPTTGPSGRVNADGRRDLSWIPDGMTGLEVPEYLRPRWELRLGSSRDLLPPLDGYDFFFHDSDHSFENQTFEYQTALRHLPSGGVLASDDVNWTPAFSNASRGQKTIRWPLLAARQGAFLVAKRGSGTGPP